MRVYVRFFTNIIAVLYSLGRVFNCVFCYHTYQDNQRSRLPRVGPSARFWRVRATSVRLQKLVNAPNDARLTGSLTAE